MKNVWFSLTMVFLTWHCAMALETQSEQLSFIMVDTRSLDRVRDAPLLLAVSCAVGLANRKSAQVLAVGDSYESEWVSRLVAYASYTRRTPEAFLHEALTKFGAILYRSNGTGAQNDTLYLPSIVTMAGVLDAIVIDEAIYKQVPHVAIVLDARSLWSTPLESLSYIKANALSKTSGLAFQDGNYLSSGMLVDWLVQQRIFVMYIQDACIPFTQPNVLLHKIVAASPWQRPVRVYGYNGMDVIFGGDLFEAETNCINVMGQV